MEGFVAAELIKQQTWSREEFELFHYRDRNGLESDFVLEFQDGRVVMIEVKASASYRPQHFSNLVELRDRLGDRFVAGIVLTSNQAGYQYADRLYGAPLSSLWEFTPD